MDSDDVQHLSVKYNPVRGTIRIGWQNMGDRATQWRLFKLEDNWD